MDAEATTNKVSTLCTACSILPLDEGRIQGAHETKGSEYSVLAYPLPRENRQYWLDYEHVDDLAGLPKLKISAEAGCEFCRALRNATLRLVPSKSGKVVYTLRLTVQNSYFTALIFCC